MFAALPMYDHAALRTEWDCLWSEIRDALQSDGIAAPVTLTRSGAIEDQWVHPDLLLGQTCGLPFRAGLHERITLLGAFDFGLPDTPAGHYSSVFVARLTDNRERLEDFRGARLSYSDPMSHSGWHVAATSPVRFCVGPRTGGHATSARAVADGTAEIAALDAVTWRILTRFDPVALSLKVVGQSETAPGLPLVTAHSNLAIPLRNALSNGIAGIPEPVRRSLGIRGFVEIPKADYLAIPNPPTPQAYSAQIA